MGSVYSRVEVRCSEKQFQQYRTTLSLAKACAIFKRRDWGDDNLLSDPQNYLC